jgi:predicted trehalose synthase
MDDGKMDDPAVPETLETIAATLSTLARSIDERFTKVDQQFAEVKAQLGVKIEAVEDKVVKVYDVVIALQQLSQANVTEHHRFGARLDNHDIRLLALERGERPTS